MTYTSVALTRKISNLMDVCAHTPVVNDVLQYNGTVWESTHVAFAETLASLQDVSISNPLTGQVLVFSNSDSKWHNSTTGYITEASVLALGYITHIVSAQDVAVSVIQNNQVLAFSSVDNKFKNISQQADIVAYTMFGGV